MSGVASPPLTAPPFVSISLATDPIEEVQLLREMGRDLAEVGSLPGAKVLFEAARVLMPDQPEVYNDLGVTHVRLREWSHAWDAFKRAITLLTRNSRRPSRTAQTFSASSAQTTWGAARLLLATAR